MSKLQSTARLRMLRGPGHLYMAYSRYCDWIKIGFTSKPVARRLEAINRQYTHFAPFSLIGAVNSTWAAEQQLHRCLSPYRRGRHALTKELYPATKPLVANVKAILECKDWPVMPPDLARGLVYEAIDDARNRLNALEVGLAFERFYAERRAA